MYSLNDHFVNLEMNIINYVNVNRSKWLSSVQLTLLRKNANESH